MNLILCLSQFLLLSFSWVDLRKIFWINIVISPIPNSTADSTRKKNVSDSNPALSNKNPVDKTNTYRVIQSSSAVRSRWRALETLKAILKKTKKNKTKYKFISPINTKNYL